MTFFTQREKGPVPRTIEKITLPVWQGLVSIIGGRIDDGSLGLAYPVKCPDGPMIIGANEEHIAAAIQGHFPTLRWPFQASGYGRPNGFAALDLVEFIHEKVAKFVRAHHHQFYDHWHLEFNVEAGRDEFRSDVNRLFEVNGLAFNLEPNGQMIRLAPPALREALAEVIFQTGDATLNELLETARGKFLSRDPAGRQEALEKLWDAFERVKTLEAGRNKADSATRLLDAVAGTGAPRAALEQDFRALTDIGNNFNIRHFEHDRTPVPNNTFVDYFFHRGFAAISLEIHPESPLDFFDIYDIT